MQTPKQVLDTSFLDMRHYLLEVAAMFDRYDAARRRTGGADDSRAQKLRDAIQLLADGRQENRAENLLNLFSDLDAETQEGKKRTHPF
jgi:thioredoxin-like negative regulator of GroEL